VSGPVIVQAPPPRGARNAKIRLRALTFRKLLDQHRWVSESTLHDTRAQASRRATTIIDLCVRHGGYETGVLERAVWQVLSGPHARKWRWAIRIKPAGPG